MMKGGCDVETYQEKTASVEGIHKISVETQSLDVELIQSESDELQATLCGEHSEDEARHIELELLRRDDELRVRITQQGHLSMFHIVGGIWNKYLRFTVYVPDRLFERITASGQSSDMMAKRLMAGKMIFLCRSGDIQLDDCVAKETLNVRASSGDITLNGVLGKGDVSVQNSSGDIDCRGLTGETISIGTHSGDLTVSDYRGRLRAEAKSGDIEIKSDVLAGDVAIHSSSGDVALAYRQADSFLVHYKGSSGEGKIRMEGLSYEEKSEHLIVGKKGDGRYRVDVRTSSGDFVLQ
jgi:hypothetical protein